MGARTIQMTFNESPDSTQAAANAVNSPTNTGHSSTTAANSLDPRSCRWADAPAQVGVISATLKVDWDEVLEHNADFQLEYSLNDGSDWSFFFNHEGPTDTNGTASLNLDVLQDISQVQVRNFFNGAIVGGNSATVTISNIRIEVVIEDNPIVTGMM